MSAPHLVLDGLQLAARLRSAKVIVYGAVPTSCARGRGPALPTASGPSRSRRGSPDAFLSGEESAVVAAVEGRPAVPLDCSRRSFERGVRGRPTLVQNVETLANLALIARYGADWFRSAGTAAEPGTRLLTCPARSAPGYTRCRAAPGWRGRLAAGGAAGRSRRC